MLTMLLPMIAAAEDVTVNGIKYAIDTPSLTASVISNSYSGDIVIPATFEYGGATYNVTSISDFAFINCSNLTKVSIPDGVTSIGNAAFSGCFGMTSVEIGDDIESIGEYAFSSCNSLNSIKLPDGLTSIGHYAFRGCI